MKRGLFCVFLAIVMLVSTIDVTVLAQEDDLGDKIIEEEEGVIPDSLIENEDVESVPLEDINELSIVDTMEEGETTKSEEKEESTERSETDEEKSTEVDAIIDDGVMLYSSDIISGKCGSNTTWSLENNTLTISGNGTIEDYSEGYQPWYEYIDTIESLVLNDGVTGIGKAAFFNYSNLQGDLKIPASVTYIGDNAFEECEKLSGIAYIPKNVMSIGENALSSIHTIYGEVGSYAEVYAKNNGITFIELDNSEAISENTIIKTADDLLEISNNVSQGISDYEGCVIQIKEDIDLSEIAWSPIGNTSEHPFRGSIQGNGCHISGIKCSEGRSGLIGYWDVQDECYIENITMENIQLTGKYSGGIVANLEVSDECKATVKDVIVYGRVDGTSLISGGIFGVVNINGNGTIKVTGCNIDVSINSDALWSDAYAAIGGIAGQASDNGTGEFIIQDCTVTGGLTTKQTYGYCSSEAGGLIGSLQVNNTKIDRCSKTGSVSCQAYYAYTGGFIGNIAIDVNSGLEINNCYVNADILPICTNGSSQGGGIIGHTGGDGGSQITISNTYVTGSMSASNKAAFVCWHSGNECPIIKNCYFDVDKLGIGKDNMVCKLSMFSTSWLNNNISNSGGLATEDMKLQSSYSEWDFDNIWSISTDKNDGYPILKREGNGQENTDEKLDETIVDIVGRYTSGKEVKEVLEIYNTSSSEEELRQRLFEYYNYDNMLDVRERIIELGDMHDERWDYEGLIRDDMYLSWQYYDYLNNTPKGAAARVALYASGLVFNGEINDWIDPSTYLDSELPGIKKYKSMLEEFIQTQSSTIEYYSYVKEVESFLNSTVGIWSATEKADIIKKLKEAPDGKSCKSYFNNFVAMKIGSGKDSMTLVFDGEKPKFMEAMGITDTVFDVVNISLDGITGLVDVSSNLETYETYHEFLKEIYEADDLPWELVVAAYQLDQELGQAYWTPIKGILNEIRDKCLGEAFDAAGFENLLNKNGWLSAINFSAFCINQFVDVGAMVVNSCHTEGYAFLAMHYKNKLEQCKQQFIANKSEENAWAFYEAYVMLWKLRTAGEKKFLQMSQLEGNKVIDGLYEATKGETLGGMISELCGYSDKEAAVNDNLKMLKGFAFKYSIKNENLPDEYKYLQKIVIECPVNVEILTSDGTQVCVLNDGVETEITNEHGIFVSFYRATTGDYAKIAYFNSDAPYVIRAIGQDTGEVTYSFARTEDHQTYTVAGFDKVNISEKDIINITTNEEKYIVDEGGDGTDDIEGEQADKSKIFVQFDYQDGKQIRVAYADANGMITMPQEPAREGYEFKGWFEDSAGLENEFAGDTIVSKSITVYAKWESKEVTILSTPTANIVSGSVVEKGTEITLTCSVEGAQICYTLDGTIPTKESMKYNVPIIINQDITINAIATKDGYQNSEVATFNYTVKDDTDKDIGEVIPDDIPSDGIIPDGIWCAGITDMTYTGNSEKQSFRVYDGMKLLKEKTDYTITYKNNKNAYTYMDEDYTAFEEKLQNTGKRVKTGTFDPGRAPQVTIKMKGNYSGSRTIYYKIEKMDITGDDFVTENLTVTYTGKKQTPVPTLTWNGKKLKYGTDFYIPEYDNAKKDKTAFSASRTYALTVAGKGNYTGEIPITLTISASSKQIAINKITVKGIKSQTWKGEQIKPAGFTASYQKDVLSEENGDYIISFGENTAVGTGTVTFTGTGLDTDGDGYSYIGSKTVSFKITGTAMSKVTVNGVGKSYTYTGNAIEPVAELTYKANKNSDPVPLTENTHYTVTYQKNMDKGTATIIFTGMESGGYTGTKKVTFKIVTDNIADKKVGDVTVEQIDVAFKDTENVQNGIYVAPYMKGGVQPEIIVTDGDRVLEPGKDYTVSYSNNKKVALSTDKKAPTITIKGKGNYSGSKNVYFTIAAKALSNKNGITVVAKDKTASTKKNGYRQSFKVYDADGKALGSSDYDSKNVIYTLIQTESADGTVNAVEEVLDKNSVVPANSVIQITVQGKGIYAGGEATGTYRILENGYDISKATIQVQDQTYTGKQVTITEQSQFKTGKVYIKIGKETRVLTLGEDIEVVPGSYEKNINKGTAKVTFRGINDFGGTKTVSFKIGTRSIVDFWQGIYKKMTGLFD